MAIRFPGGYDGLMMLLLLMMMMMMTYQYVTTNKYIKNKEINQ